MAPPPLPPPSSIDAAPASAPVCLPARERTSLALLDADRETIHVCFDPDACVAIDRHSGAITRWTPPMPPSLIVHHGARPVTVDDSLAHNQMDVCIEQRCTELSPNDFQIATRPISGDFDDDNLHLLLTFPGAKPGDAPHYWVVFEATGAHYELVLGRPGRCGEASWLGDVALVTTDDCDGSNVHGELFDLSARPIAQVGGTRTIDTHRAFRVDGTPALTIAIMAPQAYAMVVIDRQLAQQRVVDLVPIQTEATSTPAFEAMPLPGDYWLVASATGGVGIVDRTTLTFAKTWIVPRCEP
jgi:hypothetical protein